MAQDIEEFLRMAAAKKKQQANQGNQAPPPSQPATIAPPLSQQQQAPPPPRPSNQRTQPLSQPKEPDLYIGVDQPDQSYTHPNLESRIRPTVTTEDIAEHTSHLGERVHNRQEFVQTRVEQKFDHDLGRLQKKDITAPVVVDQGQGREDLPDLSFITKMLMNPGSAKQAFILKEIFDRPKF